MDLDFAVGKAGKQSSSASMRHTKKPNDHLLRQRSRPLAQHAVQRLCDTITQYPLKHQKHEGTHFLRFNCRSLITVRLLLWMLDN